MKDITLKEIAERLGISITTVSKALKNYPDVSAKTKKSVIDMAQNLHYSPNSFAVNLRTKESRTIGLIIPELVHHFFSNVVEAIIDMAEKNGYLVIMLQSNENIELEKKQVDLLINKRVDGIIMSLSNDSNYDDHIREIINRKIPFILFDKISKLVPCSKVIINDQKAAFEAVQHLIDQGCKKIAHFRGPLNPQNAVDRFIGYKKALEKNNIAFDSKLVYLCDRSTFEEGVAKAKEMIEDHSDIDGIFTVTDLVAVGALSYFNDIGIKVPEQIALIGFSNWFISEVLTPKLSTVEQPGHQMGVESFNLLLEQINCNKHGIPFTPRTIELETHTVIRASSMKIKNTSI